MEETFWLLIFYIAVINILSMFIMGSDKFSARKQVVGKARVSEGLIFFLAIIGGSLGVYASMFLFHHKTQKIYFLIGIPLLILQQFLLLQYLAFPFLDI